MPKDCLNIDIRVGDFLFVGGKGNGPAQYGMQIKKVLKVDNNKIQIILSGSLTSEKEQAIGYHVRKIEKGELGQLSKIKEELEEAMDANEQKNKIMELTELSDIYGALEARAQTLGFQMEDLKKMSDVTKRAFLSGRRK